MAIGDTTITMVGNLVEDPILRFTPSGAAVANFRVASTNRVLDRVTNEWKNGDSLFLQCQVWRQAAENVAESLTKGMRVILTGRLKQRSYETKEGEKRTVYVIDVEDIGPCLRNATAKVTRGQGGGGTGSGGYSPASSAPDTFNDDPWAAASTTSAPTGGGWATTTQDEPPF